MVQSQPPTFPGRAWQVGERRVKEGTSCERRRKALCALSGWVGGRAGWVPAQWAHTQLGGAHGSMLFLLGAPSCCCCWRNKVCAAPDLIFFSLARSLTHPPARSLVAAFLAPSMFVERPCRQNVDDVCTTTRMLNRHTEIRTLGLNFCWTDLWKFTCHLCPTNNLERYMSYCCGALMLLNCFTSTFQFFSWCPFLILLNRPCKEDWDS
jgi:hypothetical protein